jgi:HAD superfamily hydrolase (TIGR01509 family)
MLIIWDYFGVIAQDAFWYTAERMANGHGASEKMIKLHREVDLGEITWEQYCRAVSSDINVPYDEVVARYQEHRIKKQTIMAIQLMPEHSHVLLSNASHMYLLPIMEKLGLKTLFSNVFVSSQLGFAKPDKRAFLTVLQTMKVLPEDAVMVDDSALNVDAAREVGMRAVLFHGEQNIADEIQRLIA